MFSRVTPELHPFIAVHAGTSRGREAVDAVLLRHRAGKELPRAWCFSLACFLDNYGSPTETAVLESAVAECEALMVRCVNVDSKSMDDVAEWLWRCAKSGLLVGRLRREIVILTDRLVRKQTASGYWEQCQSSGDAVANLRGTAIATVALQRLGDDKHHTSIRNAVGWLIKERRSDGAWARYLGDEAPDVIATTLTMEAVRRSDFAESVPHVLTAGEGWLVAGQTALGSWAAEPWADEFVVAVVLEYLERRGSMLPQVDGFLLMARDFFRKAEAFAS
jgi:hypothetical protein